MSWEAKRERLDKLIKKGLIEEPGLDLPVIKLEFGINAQHDMHDSLIYDALLEEDFLPLPVVEPKIVQWIDELEEFEEQQLKSVSNAYAPQMPVQQKQLQPTECDICGKRFQFPVNLKRHKWRPCYKAEEKSMDSTINQFKDYWEKLEDEKACKVISSKDVVLPANVTELQLNDIIGAVSSYVEASNEEHTSIIAFLLNPEAADGCPPFQEILDTLYFLSDGTLFRGRLIPEMQRIVFPHALSMDEIREQGLLASFEFLVEYCMMKAWAASDGNHIGILLEEEEEAPTKLTQSPASTSTAKKSKFSASRRRKQNARKKEELDWNEQHEEDEEVNSLKDEEEHDNSSQRNRRDSKEIEDYPEQDSCNVAVTQSSALPSIDDSVQAIIFPSPRQEMVSESMKGTKPGDVIDDHINDAGPFSSRQPTARTRKARKHSYAQRKKRMQKQSKQSKKHTEDNSSKDKKEVDRSSQLKKSDSEQGEEEPADEPPEVDYQVQASFDAAATLSYPVQSVGNFERGDNTSSALNDKKLTESTVKGMERADLADDINDLPPLDDGGSLSEIPLLESSGGGEWGGRSNNTAYQAPDVDQQEHASSDAAATRFDLVQSVGNFMQGGSTSSALTRKKVTESTKRKIMWVDLLDDMNDLPPLPRLDGGGSLTHIALPKNSEESWGELGGISDEMADQAPARSGAAATLLDLVQSVGDVVHEELDFSSQSSQNDFEESKEIIIDEFLSHLIPQDSKESEENVIDKPSKQHEQQGSTKSQNDFEESEEIIVNEFLSQLIPEDSEESEENVIEKPSGQHEQQGCTKDAAAQMDLMPTGGQSVVERLFSAQTLEVAAEILKEVVWGDLTNEDIELFSKPPALDSVPAGDDEGSLSMQPGRSAKETEGGQGTGEIPEKSEGGEGKGKDTEGSGRGQGKRENKDAGCCSRCQQQYGKNMHGERGSGQQVHTQAGRRRSRTMHYQYGRITILRRTSETAADIDSLAAQRNSLPSKNKEPAEREDSPPVSMWVSGESGDSMAVSAKSVPEEGQEKKAPREPGGDRDSSNA